MNDEILDFIRLGLIREGYWCTPYKTLWINLRLLSHGSLTSRPILSSLFARMNKLLVTLPDDVWAPWALITCLNLVSGAAPASFINTLRSIHYAKSSQASRTPGYWDLLVRAGILAEHQIVSIMVEAMGA